MTADLKKLVGQRLHLLRMERNLTQEQMSEKLNLSTSAYCKIEYGETDLTLTRLNKIAEVLNMSATELFTKISGDTYNNSQRDYGRVWITRDSSIVNVDNSEDLRELVKSNSRLIDVLVKRIEDLEKK
ncbi:helix-turn-helix transcriptional regulator [uncultured Parabacteroides sp.]|uniref:helix-turn-helix domain-containing protein n=1 Tax=uncultured Parabacteroides sp. TaxID=512312 RepID=UPI00260CA377|nr:helix-turn-helix transcriptional regulator [uncultured Parabacteroides sp.]